MAANCKLEHRSGFLGASHVAKEQSHVHALALRAATEKLLSEVGCPEGTMPLTRVERTQLTKALPRMLPKIEAMVADGASDEQLALNFMFGGDRVVLCCVFLSEFYLSDV